MMLKLKAAFRLAALAWIAALPAPIHAANQPFQVHRAINIAQWYTWPRYEAAGSAIQWPPYKEILRPDAAGLRELRQAGFDTVRLPVDPAPFIVFDGDRRRDVYRMLFDGIARINAAGLNVILDIHPNSRHPVWGQHAVIAGVEAPAFKAVVNVIEDMARRLKGHTQTVALELLNEPRLKCKGAEQALWQTMTQQFVERARAANPDLTLVVTGACVSSPDGLMALDPAPFAAPNILYTFHYYDPFSFTHQGAQFIPWPDKYLDGVPWPAGKRPISQPAALLEARIKAMTDLSYPEQLLAQSKAKSNLERYYATSPDGAMISKRFGEVASWARKHDIDPANIFIGEFGVTRRELGKPGAYCEDRARWHQDVRKAAEINGFSWGYFNYDGPFGLVLDDGSDQLDPITLASLGMKSPCTAAVNPKPNGETTSQSPGAPGCADSCQNGGSAEAGYTP